MAPVTANDMKTQAISANETAGSGGLEAMVSVRCKGTFMVMGIAQYHYLRKCECERDAALAQTRDDVTSGRVVQETPQAHLDRLDAV